MASRRLDIVDALTALWESSSQAEYDFCGEQRDWHLPRLKRASALFAAIFPNETVEAMMNAKTPHGELLVPKD